MTTAVAHDEDMAVENVGTAPVCLNNILVALDQSDLANKAVVEAIKLAKPNGGTIIGIHSYAAKMHDRRFK